MAFFRQLKLLLWKNGLGVVRQPAWSLTLIIWPLIIFIIIAVTRNQFPPVLKQTCYVAPRNLPSAGFFPFLQTLMCNTDSYCHNTSQINPPSSKHGRSHRRIARSPIPPKNNPLARLLQGEKLLTIDIPPESMDDATGLIEFMNNIFGSSQQQKMNNASLTNVMNASLPGDQSLEELMASMTLLKKTICQSVLPMINMSSPTHVTFAVVTFCNSNNTVFEVMLVTLNQVLIDLMLTKPDEMVNFVGATLFLFDHLQNQSSLWEAFLAIPELFSSTSADQIANTTEALLTNIQGVLHIIQTNFPNISAPVQAVHPVLAAGISITRYIQNWPGKHVSISLGDVLVLYNDSLSEMVKPVLQEVEIPLDKAIALTLDRDVVRGFVCNNKDNPMWLTAACTTGTVDMFLGWISPDNLAKQVLLKWSKHVAPHDLMFAKGLLEGLMGVSSPGGQGGSNITRTRRNVETEPQNIDEELFLSIGTVVLEILKVSPEASSIVQVILKVGLESMETATLALKTVKKMVDNVLKDANQLQMNYLTLMTDPTQAETWMSRFIENVLDTLMEGLTSESMTCEDVLGRFEWLLDTESVRIEGWRAVICQNDSILPQVLLFDWLPLIDKFQELSNTLQGHGDSDATLPMILSEWHLLCNETQQFGGLLERVVEEMGAEYWMNWMLENNTSDFVGTLQQSVFTLMERLGQMIEHTQLWPEVKAYFHMAYWILNYRPGVTTQPANCSVVLDSFEIRCDTGFNWRQFVHTLSQALMSPCEDVLLNCLKGTVNLLQHMYGDIYKYLAASNLKNEIQGGDALSDFLINLMNNLNDFTQNLTRLPDQSISNPYVMFPLYNHLLQSTGLAPLLPLILSDGPFNITQVFEVVSKLGRLNQHIFTFNETDPTMPDLERLIMQFLSSEGNLTMSLALSMGNSLLTYSQYISPEDVARLREAMQPFTNQTSAGIVEAILSAIELVKTVMDSPDGDPTTIILGYIQQLQECIMSLLQLRKTEQLMLPNGQLITTQVTDLNQPTVEILNLLTPKRLQALAQVGPNAAQDIIAQKFLAFLPAAVRQQAAAFLQDFKALQHQLTQCATGQNCLAGISEIFTFLDQILDMMVSAKGNVSIEIATSQSFLGRQEYEELASMAFSLLLSPNDVASATTFKQTLLFIRLVMANPNITVSHVQNALKQSNLTIEELNHIASLAGSGSMNDLVVNILTLISSYQCFEQHPASEGTTECVVGLINGISSFLMHVPALQKQAAILSIIPLIVNKTLNNIAYADFSSHPDKVVFQTLNSTLANVKMALHMNNLITPEIMNEFQVLENILKVAADPTPLQYILNLTTDPFLAQKAVQEMIMWYLKRLENVTSSSSISHLLNPFFQLSQMQVALQLAQTDVSIFVSNRIEQLMHSLQYPLGAEGLRKIGLAVVEILQRMSKLVMGNLDAQNSIAEILFSVLPFNTTALDVTELQITRYLNFIQQWLTQPNAPNLSIEELNHIAAQAGAASIGDLVTKIMALVNYHQCFEQHPGPDGTTHCVMGLMNGIGSFLMHVPALKDEAAILSLIPVIVNQTISNIMNVNFSSNPQMAVMETLTMTLDSIKMTLQMNNLSSPEIMSEIRLIENLLKVGADPTALSNIYNASMHPDPLHAQKAVLETLSIYLKRLESATNGSSVSLVLAPFFHFSQMQVALQVAQVDFSIFINNQIDYLMESLQYPLDAEGLRKIGLTTVEILRCLFKLVMINLDAQNNLAIMQELDPPFNATCLDATKVQVHLYLNIIQQWMTPPNALQHSNLTTEELNHIAAQAGAASIGDLVAKIMALVNYHQCFEQHPGPDGTTRCVMGLMNGISNFLTHVPALKNEAAILSLIPVIVNQTISNIMHVNFSSNPQMAVIRTLNMTLDSIKMTLQMNNLSNPEIMSEIRLIENLLKVGADPTAFSNVYNVSMHPDPLHAQKAVLETLSIYLKRLESATNASSVSHVLTPLFDFSQMQVALQVAQVDFSIFISNRIDYLMESLQYPLDAEGLRKIGLTTVEILRCLFKLVMINLDAQNNLAIMQDTAPPFNATFLDATKVQVNLYLNIIQQWMTPPNALQHSNLTTEELNHIAAQAGFASVSDLLVNIMRLVSSHQCFEEEPSPAGTARCVMGLIMRINGFLSHVPALKDEKAILSLIPFIFNKTISNIMHANFSSNPHMAVLETLNMTLASIKMTLQMNNLSSPEIMNELRMIENLLKIGADPTTLANFLNATMYPDPLHAQKAFLEILSKSLKRLENATSGSSITDVLHSILRAAQMQVELQLAQINFSIFISNQIDYLTQKLQFPLNAEGMSKIGKTAIEILRRVLKLIRQNVDAQNNGVKIHGFEMPLNATLLAAAEFQINLYLNIIEQWMAQPNVFVVLNSMLQWGNSSSYATPVDDFYHLLQTILPFLNEDQRVFLSFIGNITQSLNKALTVAQQPNGLQSDHFIAAILEAIQTVMSVSTPASGPVPVSLQQNILGVVQYSVKLIVHPDLSYASARNLSLLILTNTEGFIQQTIPKMVAQYMLAGVKIATTYFETISTSAGPDNFNELILNEMKTIHSLLPPNSTARAYISALINITHFILASGQDNTGLFGSFENASAENIPLIIEQMGKLLNMIWRLIMGSPDLLSKPESLTAFSQLAQVLEQVIEERATPETWHNLKMMLEAVLSIIEETEHWESVPSVVSLLEKAIGTLVMATKAETGLIVSLQVPVMTLMTEIAQSVNSSHFNVSEFSKRMQQAIEGTLVASQQANGTLECSNVLKIWEGVRKAAGLSHNVMAVWCNASLQPVIEAHAEADKIFAHLNMTHTGMGPMTVNATAARIVKTVQSLYYVSINQSRVMEQFVMAFSRQLNEIAGQPLSPEAEFHWYKQLQDMQWENSLMTLRMVSEELLSEFPFLQPYVEAVEEALTHILYNYDFMKGNSSSQKVFSEAAMIFLSSANITSDMFMMWGNFSDLNAESIADTMIKAVKMVVDMKIFGEAPMVYETLEQLLTYSDTRKIFQKFAELLLWLTSTQPSGPDFLTEALPELVRCILSFLKQMIDDLPINMGPFEGLPENIIEILRKLLSASGVLPPTNNNMNMRQQPMQNGNNTAKIRRKRELPEMPMRSPVDDIVDLLFIDYSTMFSSLSVRPTQVEMIDTAHVFFANPDLGVVVKGATSGIQWDMNPSREKTIDAVLGMASSLTLPEVLNMSSIELVMNAVDMLPDDFPFSSLLKNITRVLASESQGNLRLMQETINTATMLFQTSLTDPRFMKQLSHLRAQACTLENTNTMHLLMHNLGMQPDDICHVLLPGVQNLVESLVNHTTTLFDIIYQTFVGDLNSMRVQNNWGSVFTQSLGFNISSLSAFSINITMPGAVTIGEMLRNKTAFILDVQQYMGLDDDGLYLLIETPLPNNNLQILSWLVDLRHCNSTQPVNMEPSEEAVFRILCSMSVQQWYSLTVLTTRHMNLEKFIYRILLPEEMQNLVGVMLQMAKVIINMMNKILPAIDQLQSYMHSIQDLNLAANSEFRQVARGQRKSISSKATFVTISRALCSNGILALLGISKIPKVTESYPSFTGSKREEMIERFKIPRNATPFCTNMYLDMVNTTGGAIAWAFLKPMLMGHILYTPDTPLTRAIMEKSNLTLHEFGNLRKHSQDWIESSDYLIKSSELLSHTLPMLQNSLGNSFVKNFIEMQTDINVGRMKETLGNFSNMTEMLEKNKDLLNQITTLSTLMVDLSSCIKFDRFRGYDSADQLNTDAQELAKNRDLYASVIFKLPKEKESQKSSPSTSALPPKVSYTIRMHMDNVMRTDRVRDPYFVKDPHISAAMTMRYNRGFIYLQETIDRAIIETQAGRRITEPAVQLQPFPYPCHLRDEYLEAISFVFPLMLMIAWVLFVADFVKKLVHERELRLHEYMKMMGVNPLSHFFAWFLECASYLMVTIIILTLLLKFGHILPHSDGFLIFLYLCDYGLSILAFSYLVSSFFDQTYIAGLSGSLLYILAFFPFIVVMAVETKLTFCQKSLLSLFSPTCFSYASQYIYRYEAQAQGIQWSNSYLSPIAGDSGSFGWLCWLMLIDSILYFILGAYIRMVFPGKYGIAAPWYFPFKASFWAELCCRRSQNKAGRGLFFTNIMQSKQAVLSDDKGKGHSALSSQAGEDCSELPVGVSLHGLSKIYGERVAIDNLNVTFYEGHVTSLLGHNGAGKTTTMSLLTGLFAPSSGTIEVYGKDMQTNINAVRKELGVCMQYDVLFDHMTAKEHLLLYGQIKAPHWSQRELREQVRTILEETGMYAHRHKRVGTLSGGMKRKLSISIAFIGGSRLVVLDEPTTGVDPCSRRNIWDIVIQHKKHRTIIMSTHHLDEAEVLSDRIAFLEKGGLKCCGSPFYLKDKLGQGYKLTITKKTQNLESEQIDDVELKSFIQAHVPEARLKEAQGSDLIYLLPPFSSSNSSSYRSLLTALDANLDALQLGCYGISDTTLEEVFLHMTHGSAESAADDGPLTISETVSDSGSIDSFPTDPTRSIGGDSDKFNLTGSSMVEGAALVWQQIMAILIKRFHHSRRDWKGLISQILLPVLFVVFAMGLGSIKNDLQHFPELELSPALYNIGPSYTFFSNQNPNSSGMVDAMLSFPGIDNACLDKSNDQVCSRTVKDWESTGSGSKMSGSCKCLPEKQVCDAGNYQPPHKKIPSSQTVYNLSGINLENYLVVTGNGFIRNRYGGFAFGKPLPLDLQIDLKAVPKNRTLSKVWFNPEGHHTMPAYLNSLNNIILRANLPADKDPREYAISVSSHPYFGRRDDEDSIVQGMLQILVAMCVLTGYSITTASFAIYEVNEHHTGSKRLQHIAGISEPLYWAVNFFYDMVLYMIPVTVTIGVIAAFQISAFTDRQNLGAVALLLVLFGFATFPWMYLLSSVFKDAEMAFITYVCINLFISINTIASTSILYFLSQISVMRPEAIMNIFNKLSHAFVIFPQFNFGNGLMMLARKDIEVQILSGYGVDAYKSPFCIDTLGWMFLASFVEGVLFFTLRLLLNKFIVRKIRRLIFRRKTVPQVACEDEDEDVVAEHQRVASGAAGSDILQVNQLTKIYQHFKKKVHAVKRLSVGIPAGECFGLLGVNGAGKTTTFKMLTGDVSPTDGTAQIRDRDGRLVDIMECRNQGINIGYCPQVDALDDLLTGEEHLYFYARVHGIAKREIRRVVNYLLKRLELTYHRNIITDSYSCGTRRKLSTALALVGHPQILLLDEPSSGMDPRTKRHLWKIISEEVKGKCAVVLTSHSMEECEALCSRLAIMVKGQFRCLGSLQHIKNRFGSGFTVKMYLAEASCDAEAITGFMQRRFPSTYLKDQHSTMVEYHVPVAPGGVADIFDQLESNKNALQIKHFSVSQTTLDEVFINFAMGKVGMEAIPIDSEEEFDDLGSVKEVET